MVTSVKFASVSVVADLCIIAARRELYANTTGNIDKFYKSLEGKERRSIERGVQAVLLFCTEGPSYPGLEVKQIEGQEIWSLRASLKLRVYFELLEERCVEFVAVADREDQHTTLRRLKER